MEFDPDVEGEEAGVGVWWSRFAFMVIGVRRGEGGDKKGRYVFLRWVDPDSGEHRVSGQSRLRCRGVCLLRGGQGLIVRSPAWLGTSGNPG